MADPIEEILKEGLKKEVLPPVPMADCPEADVLWDYLKGTASRAVEEKISSHLVQCEFCLESLLSAQEVQPGVAFGPDAAPPYRLLEKAISLARRKGRPKVPFRRQMWLFLSLLAIVLSFFLPRYFFQCLLLGAIFGFKWVFDTITNRTLIVMYDTLKKRGFPVKTAKEVEEKLRKRH